MTVGTGLKVVFTGMLAVFTAHFHALLVPFLLLVLCNVIDYVTGLVAAPYRNEVVSSYKGFRGIAKKVYAWLLVLVGVVVDVLITHLAQQWGMQINLGFAVGCVVCVWLLLNEMISIVENLADIGVSVPVLLPLIKWMRGRVEQKGTLPTEGDEDEKEDAGDG